MWMHVNVPSSNKSTYSDRRKLKVEIISIPIAGRFNSKEGNHGETQKLGAYIEECHRGL